MAKDLDRVNCQLYLRTGVCRRNNHCTGYHNCPTISRTLLLSNMYQRLDKITPGIDAEGNPIDPNQIQEHFEDFYKDIFKKLSKYGEIRCLHVCDNLAYHMAGNVYVQFCDEKQAKAALKGLQGMLDNNGRPIRVHYSPVTSFYQATCGLFEKHRCERGFKCDLLHLKKIRHTLMRKLYSRYNQSRSRSPSFRRDRERSHERGDHRDRDRKRHERLRYSPSWSRSRSRSRSPSFRRDGGRSHERGDHRDRDQKRYGRLRYSRSGSRSPSFRRDRERSHERDDLRDRDRVRHEMRYERSLGGRGIGGVKAGAGALVTEGIVERGHMKEVIKGAAVGGTEIGKGMKGGLRGGQGSREGRSRSPVRVSREVRRAKIENILGYQD